jgi:transcriptional regulator with XRE-family HTH domain
MNAGEKDAQDFELIKVRTGEIIRSLRMAYGKTNAEVSSGLHMPPEWLQEVEAGRREISFAEFQSICKIFGMTAGEVMEFVSRSNKGRSLQ